MSLPLSLLLVAIAVPAHAAVYKCSGDKGGVIYQDTACAPGRELGNVDVDPGRINVIPGAPSPAGSGAAVTKPARLQSLPAPNGDASQRRFLQAGMSKAEVIQKVGRPDVEAKAAAKTGPRWTYLPTAGDPKTQTTLTFAGGKVALVERKVLP